MRATPFYPLVRGVLVVGIVAAARTLTAEQKAPIPDTNAQIAAKKAAAEVYGSRFRQSKTAAAKIGLAKEMVDAASKIREGSADQYVLLTIARDVATGAGDTPTALGAVEKLAARFDVTGAKLKADALVATARHTATSSQHKAVTEAASGVVAELVEADEYGAAVRLCHSARSAAQKAKQYAIARQFKAQAQDLRKQEAAAKDYREAMAVLEKTPGDPAANLTAGQYLCFIKGEWDRGVPMLALGSDSDLKELATKDLKGAATAEDQAALGDGWWALAERKEEGEEKESLRLRAATWYRRAQPRLDGLARLKVNERLEEVATSKGKPSKPPVKPRPEEIASFDDKSAREYQARWAKQLNAPLVYANSIGMRLVLIPPGQFEMGSTKEEVAKFRQNAPGWFIERVTSEAPKHRVRITRPFYLGVCEVTQGEFERVMGSNPSEFPGDRDRPVEKVTWYTATAFCRRLNQLPQERAARAVYRLPTEAEWEYACRAGTKTRYSFGDDAARLSEYAWWAKNSQGQTHPVGRLKPNAFGLYDMHGNVYEWCADWHAADYYAKSPAVDPTGPPSGQYRVLRGGSWRKDDPRMFRSAYRHFSKPTVHLVTRRGFRVVATFAPWGSKRGRS